MLWNTLLLALRAIRRNLMRSFLTTLGIVIGVAAVVTMVTVGRGATQAVRTQIESLGSNLLMVRPGQRLGRGQGAAGAPPFKAADVSAIATQIGGIAAVAPEVRSGVTVVAEGRNWATTVTGSNNDWFPAGNWKLADEPTGNLDSERGREIMELLAALNRERGITVVMVTHEPEMAAYARRVVRFRDGLVAGDEPVAHAAEAA